MFPNLDVLFQPVTHPYQFSAIGYLLGSFQPTPTEEIKRFIPGKFLTSEGIELIASIRKRNWEKYSGREDFSEDAPLYWRLYFRTTKGGNLTKIELIKPLINSPLQGELSGETKDEITDLFKVRGRIERIFQDNFSVRVERNELPPKGKENSLQWKPFSVTIQGSLPEIAVAEQFWELLCTRVEECLRLKKATLITEEMVQEWEKNQSSSVSNPSSKSTLTQSKKNQQTSQSVTPLRESKIIMINGRQPEMTVKFSERPDVPAQGKKVTLQVTGENGIVVKAELNRKTLAKQVEKMDSFDSWIGALSGKVSSLSPDGVVTLETAGVQVFEKRDSLKQRAS
jgi:hypothetical protein